MQEKKIVNAKGGVQSDIEVDWRYIPWDAVRLVCSSLTRNASEHGGDYELDNWRKIPSRDHANHAINHLISLFLTIDREGLFDDDMTLSDSTKARLMLEAVHAANRTLMVVALLQEELSKHGKPNWKPNYPDPVGVDDQQQFTNYWRDYWASGFDHNAVPSSDARLHPDDYYDRDTDPDC